MLNSVVISAVTVVGVLILASLAGYAFATLDFPGKELFFISRWH